MTGGEVRGPSDESCHNELDEGDQESFYGCQVISSGRLARSDVPLSGSHLMAWGSAKVHGGD